MTARGSSPTHEAPMQAGILDLMRDSMVKYPLRPDNPDLRCACDSCLESVLQAVGPSLRREAAAQALEEAANVLAKDHRIGPTLCVWFMRRAQALREGR